MHAIPGDDRCIAGAHRRGLAVEREHAAAAQDEDRQVVRAVAVGRFRALHLHHPDTSHGASHKKCAETCAKKGLPMGLLTDDKQVYVLLEDHQNPDGYAKAIGAAATTITVEGTKVNQGGMSGIVVESVK